MPKMRFLDVLPACFISSGGIVVCKVGFEAHVGGVIAVGGLLLFIGGFWYGVVARAHFLKIAGR